MLNPRTETIAIDLLGHGRTDKPDDWSRYSIQAIAADVLAIVAQLNIAPVDLLGYSMGGRLALYLAYSYPELFSSLILESASPGIADISERETRQLHDSELADNIQRDGVRNFVDFWEHLPLFESQHAVPEKRKLLLRQQRMLNDPAGIANCLRGMGTGRQPSLWGSLTTIAVPALLISGALDQKFVRISREMVEQLPSAELTIVPDTGHNVHFEQPEQFSQIVRNFLTDAAERT
jgi:2-succinyl-6-hydroxy-2,4-cyclohexadiene-1-carboxylate synthase